MEKLPKGFYKVAQDGGCYISATFYNPDTKNLFLVVCAIMIIQIVAVTMTNYIIWKLTKKSKNNGCTTTELFL